MTEKQITKAEFARVCQVSKPAVAKWVAQGCAIEIAGRIDVTATVEAMSKYRRHGVPPGLTAWLSGAVAPNVPRAPAGRPSRRSAREPRTVELRREQVMARLRALDWTVPFDADPERLKTRARTAAQAVGLQMVESSLRDDGHWGGYQLRSAEVIERSGGLVFGAIADGYGFELDDYGVLWASREVLDWPEGLPDDLYVVDLALLPALAFPFGPHHKPDPIKTEGA